MISYTVKHEARNIGLYCYLNEKSRYKVSFEYEKFWGEHSFPQNFNYGFH